MYWHGSLDNTRRTVEKVIADRAKGILVITGIGSTPCPLEGLKSTLDSITLNEMSFGSEEELFIDAKGVSMPSPGQVWGTKAFLVDGAQAQPTGDEAFIRRVEAVPMKVMFEPKEGTDQPNDGIDVLSHAEIDDVVNYMRMGMHDRVAAKKGRDDKMLVTGKYEKNEFVARVIDHIADQYDGPVGSDLPTWDFPRMGADSDNNHPDAANFRRLSVGSAPHDDEDGISDEKKSDSDPEEAYTAVRSVVSIPKHAAEEVQENPKVAELKERLIKAYPRLFSGVANKNPPDRGRFGTARIKLKPNPKIYRHREYQLQGDRAEAMRKLLAEFIERGWIEPSDSEWASPAFIVPKKEKGEWRLVVDYRSFERADGARLVLASPDRLHPPKTTEKADLHGVGPETRLSPDAATPGLQALYSDVDAAGAHAVESGAHGRKEWQRRFPAHDGGPNRSCPGPCRSLRG